MTELLCLFDGKDILYRGDFLQYIKELMDFHQWNSKVVVALSGKRLINDIERETMDRYAPKAVTEYDAINAGLECGFNVKNYEEKKKTKENMQKNIVSVRFIRLQHLVQTRIDVQIRLIPLLTL